MNPYEELARQRKAGALAAALEAADATSDSIAQMTEADWIKAAAIAGVRPPSVETRMAVYDMVRGREEHKSFYGRIA